MAKRGGKKSKRGKKKGGYTPKRELVLKGEEQEYAQVTKMLGNGRLTAFCFDGKERMCKIRGKMNRRVWINLGDIILVSLRDFQDEKADVILKYWEDEANILKNNGHLPKDTKIEENMQQENGSGEEENVEEDDIIFDIDAI